MDRQFVLSFNEQDLLILNKALVSLPFSEVAPLIFKINEQLKNLHHNEKGAEQ